MQLKAILNRIEKQPSFVYESVRFVEKSRLEMEVVVRRATTRRVSVDLSLFLCGALQFSLYMQCAVFNVVSVVFASKLFLGLAENTI
jgi:hypothetical protein